MPDPYGLEPTKSKPNLPGSVVVRPNVDELIDAVAADLTAQAMGCVRRFGDFHIALSGGSTPMPLYRRLMYDPAYRQLPWKRTHLWIVDERRVPFEDDRSNFKEIDEIIGIHSDIPRAQIHPIQATEPDADVRYERELAESLIWREKGHDRLDYVLLGMGADGHTASLFPRSPALMADLQVLSGRSGDEVGTRALKSGADYRMVRMNAGPTVTPPDRVTMTLATINAARFIAVMVTGEKKRPMIERVLARSSGAADVPILGVIPQAGELRWYLDQDACPV